MKTLIKEFELGRIEYRMPNVVESMRLLGKMGIRSDGTTGGRSEFEVMADLIEHLAPMIIKIEAEKAGQPIVEWNEAISHVEFIKPLSEIANEILQQFSGDGEKSKRRKKS